MKLIPHHYVKITTYQIAIQFFGVHLFRGFFQPNRVYNLTVIACRLPIYYRDYRGRRKNLLKVH